MLIKSLLCALCLITLNGCKSPEVCLVGPLTFSLRHTINVYDPLEIPFFAIISLPNEGRERVFQRDSVVISIFASPDFEVKDIAISALNLDFEEHLDNIEKTASTLDFESLSKSTGETLYELQDSIYGTMLKQSLPKLGKTVRAREYDDFLSNTLDTGRTGRVFHSFKRYMPIKIPPSMKASDLTIFGRITVIPNAPGRFRMGLFMSLDNINEWHSLKQDSGKSQDTVLTSFIDCDTLTITGTGISLGSKQLDDNNKMNLAVTPNPLNIQGGVISFLTGRSGKVTLYDITGKTIFTEPVQGKTGIKKYLISRFTKRPLVAGKYFIQLSANGKKITKPITVIR